MLAMGTETINYASEFGAALAGDGITAPCIGLTLYTAGINSQHIASFTESAMQVLGSRLTQYWAGSASRPRRMDGRASEVVPTWLEQRKANTACNLYAVDDVQRAPSAAMRIFLRNSRFFGATPEEDRTRFTQLRKAWEESEGQTWVDPSARLCLDLPLDHPLAQNPDQLLSWISELPLVKEGVFISGHCGLEMTVELGSHAGEGYERIAALAAQHPGLGFHSSLSDMRLMDYLPTADDYLPRIRRADWLTLLSEKAVRHLSGIDAMHSSLLASKEDIELHEVKHGLILRAGQHPVAGSRARPGSLRAYEAVARVVRPVRVTRLKHPLGMDDAWANEWLDALDDMPA